MTERELLDVAVKAVEIYAARHPRPSQVTLSQAAEMMGRSRPTAKRILDFQRIRPSATGYYRVEDVDRLLTCPR